MQKFNRTNKVYQYSLNWELIDIYESIKEASFYTWINYNTIFRMVNWYVRNPRKFIFKYKV